MSVSFYNVSIDRGSGIVRFPAIGFDITPRTTRAEMTRGLAPITARENSEDGLTSLVLKRGTFLGLPCTSGPMFKDEQLLSFNIVIAESCGAVGLMVEQHLGFRISKSEQRYPWGALFADRTPTGNVVLLHMFAENIVER